MAEPLGFERLVFRSSGFWLLTCNFRGREVLQPASDLPYHAEPKHPPLALAVCARDRQVDEKVPFGQRRHREIEREDVAIGGRRGERQIRDERLSLAIEQPRGSRGRLLEDGPFDVEAFIAT